MGVRAISLIGAFQFLLRLLFRLLFFFLLHATFLFGTKFLFHLPHAF